MSDVISDYQKWKQQGDQLRAQAKQAMETRFRDLLLEAVRISVEYRADFGSPLKPSSPITAFRFKAPAKTRAKKAAKPKAEPAPQKPNPKTAGLQKRLATAKRKLDEDKAAGKPTRAIEDRIYEIEDELRLATARAGA
jgi:hypothetical protein